MKHIQLDKNVMENGYSKWFQPFSQTTYWISIKSQLGISVIEINSSAIYAPNSYYDQEATQRKLSLYFRCKHVV